MVRIVLRRNLLCVGLISLVALAVAGCGSSSKSSSSKSSSSTTSSAASTSTPASASTSASTTAATSTPTGAPLRIGLICGCSGPTAGTAGGEPTIAAAWVNWTNAHGGINGHPVKVYVGDDMTNPTTSITQVKKLIEQDKVQTLVDGSYVETVWGPIAGKAGVPVTGGNSTQPGFNLFPLFFPASGGFPATLYGMMALTHGAGKTKLGLVGQAGLPVVAALVKALESPAKTFGITVVPAGTVSVTQPNFTATCLNMKNSGADAAFVAMSSDIVVRLVRQCVLQGYKPQQVTTSNVVSNNFTANPVMNGLISAQNNAPLGENSTPGMQEFNAAMQQYAASLEKTTQWGEVAVNEWAGYELFKAAALAAHLTPSSPPSETVAGLYKLHDETLGGLAPPLTFTPGQPTDVPCYFRQDIENGAYTAPDGAKATCVAPAALAPIAAVLTGGKGR
jgi:branched-chain amino acid transport system substrate-binding protein